MRPKILVVGSLAMDQTVTTSIFPNQGQTIIADKISKAPGGKGANQAVQMARLGAEVYMCGKVGNDANGQELKSACEKDGINLTYLFTDEEVPTGCAIILLEDKGKGQAENRILIVPAANMAITEQDISPLKEAIKDFSMVVLQFEIPMAINLQVAKWAYENGVPVMLNPAPSAEIPAELLKYVTYISPNEHEAQDISGMEIKKQGKMVDTDTLKAAAEALRSKGVENVIITLGSSGASYYNGELLLAPAVEGINAVDPTAAGDSFVGAFCVAVCKGMKAKEAMDFANCTAALTVTKTGAQPSLPSLAEVEAFMKKQLK